MSAALVATGVALVVLLRSSVLADEPWRESFAKAYPEPKLDENAPAWVMPLWERINVLGRGETFGDQEKQALFEIMSKGAAVKIDHVPDTPMTEDAYWMWLGERASGQITSRFFMMAPMDNPRGLAREYGRILVEWLRHPRPQLREHAVVHLVESRIGALPDFQGALSQAALDEDPQVRSLARLKIDQLNQNLDSARARGVLQPEVHNLKIIDPP